MKNVSNDFKKAMEMRQDFYCTAEIVFADKSTRTLGKKDFEISGNSYTESAESNSFPLGMVIPKQISLSLVNYDDRWSEYDFQWAKIFLKTKFDLDDGSTETINIGRFTVISPETYGTTIEVIAMDDSYKLDKDYESGLRYPVRISEALRESCSKCDVSLKSVSFENDDYMIQEKPEKLTHRQFIGLCAMIAGGNARFDEFNRLEIITYDFSEFEKLEWLDGGVFDNSNPYAETYETGDDADGGSFKPWNTGYIADGGAFGDRDKVHILYDFKSGLTVGTDDVVITGVKLKGKEDKEYLFGKEGYVLSIENALASGQEEHTAALIGQKIVGLQFRPFSGDHISYPLAEFGDLALVIDRKQNVYRTVLTDVNFVYYGFTGLKCSADSPLRNSSKYYGNEVKAIVEARQNTEKQLSEYDKNVQIMTSILANSMGMFTTVKKTESGGEIIYQHDKPTLEESQKIWKKSEDGFLVSSDGGETWNAGMDSSGNAFLNVLSVVGFYFDWAKGGTLTLGGYDNKHGEIKILDKDGVEAGEISANGIVSKRIHVSQDFVVETSGMTQITGRHIRLGDSKEPMVIEQNTDNSIIMSVPRRFLLKAATASDRMVRVDITDEGVNLNTDLVIRNKLEFTSGDAVSGIIECTGTHFNVKGSISCEGYVQFGNLVSTYVSTPILSTDKASISKELSVHGGGLYIYGLESYTSAINLVYSDSSHRVGKMSSSSQRYKEDMQEMKSEEISNLYNLPVRTFLYKENYLSEKDERYKKRIPGFIAEEIEEILPIAVNHNEDGSPEMWNAQILIPCMMKMIQEQKKRIDTLEERLGDGNGNTNETRVKK